MDEKDLEIYDMFENAVSVNSDNVQHVVMHHPDKYIQVVRENIKLRKEIDRIKPFEFKWQMEMQLNLNMIDKLKWCEDALSSVGITMPFRCDGTPK